MPISKFWSIAGFINGFVGMYLALRHQDYDGRWKALSKFFGIGVSAALVGTFTALSSLIGQRALRNQHFLVEYVVLGLMNLAFVAVPEIIMVMVEGNQKKKR